MCKKLLILWIGLFLAFGCAGSPKKAISPADAAAEHEKSAELKPLESVATRVPWPELEADGAFPKALSIMSGEENDEIWVEAKGYIESDVEKVVAALRDGNITAPLNMTKNFTIEEVKKTDNSYSYVIHCIIRFIVKIEFDLTWTVVKVANGYDVMASKTAGSSHIHKIEHRILIRDVGNGWTSFEMRSENAASMNKEEENRAYVDELFERIIGYIAR